MGRRRRPSDTRAVWVSDDGNRRFYTRRARRWQISVLVWVFAVIALLGPAAEFEFYDTPRVGVPFVGLVLAAATWATVAAIRCGILVEPGLITNRRMLWTNRVPARQIAGFEPPPPYGTLRRSGIRVVLHDGRVLSISAFTKGRIDKDSVGKAESAELNAWLQGQGSAHVALPLH